MLWKVKNKDQISSADQLIKSVLNTRKIVDIDTFLNPPSPLEIQPTQLKIKKTQLKKAIVRINQAVVKQQKVVIFGDYDADGITATSILWLTLKQLGLVAVPFIPDRLKHGYGISVKALKEVILAHNPDLIITVDNGIVANEPLDWLETQKIDVIVTDHHQPTQEKLSALSVVHSTQVSGACVAWMLAKKLLPNYATNLLDLVTISTIADQMPLLAENRSIVRYGLELMRKEQRPGIKALLSVAGIDSKQIDVGTIGFALAPRINAAGRISQGLMAVRLLCTQDEFSAMKIAKKMNSLNQQRQDLTTTQFEEADIQAQEYLDKPLIIVSSSTFHEGIIGLLAGRLTEKYFKPSIVIATEGKIAKASARSVSGVNITNLIKHADDLLLSVGGHQLAAGFSARTDLINQVTQTLSQIAVDEINPKLLQPTINIDAIISAKLVSVSTVKKLDKLRPFGLGNPEPLLLINDLIVEDFRLIGKNKEHLKLLLASRNYSNLRFEALGWRQGERAQEIKVDEAIELVGVLEINNWNGSQTSQVRIKDFRLSKDK